jgi:hypothetical protein
MRFFYLDPGLRDNVGHHANLCRYIVGELRARGVETLIFAFREVDPVLRSELKAIPHFRVHTYADSDGDPVCGWLTAFDSIVGITLEDLSNLPPPEASDIVYASSARPAQLMALGMWRRALPFEGRPTIVVESVSTGLMVQGTPDGFRTTVPDPRGDSRATLFRYAAKKCLPSERSRFHFVTFGRTPSLLFNALLEYPVRTLPLPYRAVTSLRDRTGARPIVVAILGHQKITKGYERLPEVVVELLRVRPEIRLLLQNVDPVGPPEIGQELRRIAANNDHMVLDEKPAGRTEWPKLLEMSDLILCPHLPEYYVSGLSTVAAEALANGIPLVVPAGTPLETLLTECGGAGTAFARFEAGSIAAATGHAIDHFDRFASLAHAAALRWPEARGPQRMVDDLLSLAGSS